MEAARVMGEHAHPEITMHTYPLARYMEFIERGDWQQVAELMLFSTRKLAQASADFVICPDNTIHQAFDLVAQRSPLPWLHIADQVARAAVDRGFTRLGLTGTRYLMEGPVYPVVLQRYGISSVTPSSADRERINAIIFDQLVAGAFPEESRLYLNGVIERLKHDGCQAVILGCTELPLIVRPDDAPLPTLDSTRLLARAALRRALEPA